MSAKDIRKNVQHWWNNFYREILSYFRVTSLRPLRLALEVVRLSLEFPRSGAVQVKYVLLMLSFVECLHRVYE